MLGRLSPNALGALYMTLGSLAYVINDALIRVATEQGLNVYQALFLRTCVMIPLLAAACRVSGEPIDRRLLARPVLLRVAAEVVAAATFFAALIHLEFANAQTILMLVPFVVTLLAGTTLGESVPLRRYLTVALGFIGVVAVVRPTPADFSPWSLAVVASAGGLVVREFATRRIATDTPSLPIALGTGVTMATMMGLVSAFTGWGALTAPAVLALGLASLCLIAGYWFTIETVRVGDLSVSAPFRYASVVGAVIVGLVMFDETPDLLTFIGCVVIVAAGVTAARLDVRAERVSRTEADREAHSQR